MDAGLVADVGRHAVRFALADRQQATAPYEVRRYGTEQHSTFTGALLAYLEEVGRRGARMESTLAIAGAVYGDLVNITGSRWYISLEGIAAVLGERPRAINECAANAMALTTFSERDFRPLPGPRPTQPSPRGRYLAIGVGSGLGNAGLLGDGQRFHTVDSEAGHMRLLLDTQDGQLILDWYARKGITPQRETFISGPGLASAYAALSGETDASGIDPREVVRRATGDAQARAACDLVAGAIWMHASDMALAFGAWNGVFLMGAVARALAPMLAAPALRTRFESVGAFRRQMSLIPVSVVERDDLELAGAATAMRAAALGSIAN